MKAAAPNRFLVVCALVSDLYCREVRTVQRWEKREGLPAGYNPRQSLEKDSNLARTAARYKVDSTKVAARRPSRAVKKKTSEGGT
jgi:hypothetical protein